MEQFLNAYRCPCAELNIDYRLANTGHSVETLVRAYLEERRRLSR
jgi:hypothetical protein